MKGLETELRTENCRRGTFAAEKEAMLVLEDCEERAVRPFWAA